MSWCGNKGHWVAGGLLVFLAVAPVFAATDGKAVLAHTDAGDVTLADVEDNLKTLSVQTRQAMLENQDQLDNFVRLLAAQKILLKEAEDKGFGQRPEVVAAVDSARRNAVLQSYLADKLAPPKDYPSEAEIEQAYDAGKPGFAVPRKFHLAQIFIAVPITASADDQDKAQNRLGAILGELNDAHADFGKIAAASSEDTGSVTKQGDIGLLPEPQLEQKLRDAVLPLVKNAVSEPVRLNDGWHIFKMLEIVPASIQPLSAVRDQIVQALRERKQMADERSYIDTLTKKIPTIDAAALRELANAPAP
jgi:peptidylprolyl isomerase